MVPEQNKARVRRFVEEVFNRKEVVRAGAHVATDIVDHGPCPGHCPGLAGFTRYCVATLRAFPDYHMRIDAMIAEGDLVVTHVTTSATQTGVFLGIPPTGQRFSIAGISVLRLAHGKIVEHWGTQDDLGLLRQNRLESCACWGHRSAGRPAPPGRQAMRRRPRCRSQTTKRLSAGSLRR